MAGAAVRPRGWGKTERGRKRHRRSGVGLAAGGAGSHAVGGAVLAGSDGTVHAGVGFDARDQGCRLIGDDFGGQPGGQEAGRFVRGCAFEEEVVVAGFERSNLLASLFDRGGEEGVHGPGCHPAGTAPRAFNSAVATFQASAMRAMCFSASSIFGRSPRVASMRQRRQ